MRVIGWLRGRGKVGSQGGRGKGGAENVSLDCMGEGAFEAFENNRDVFKPLE